jgi:hypothetical protein
LNNNASLAQVVKPVISATAPLDASSSPSSSDITTALGSVCSASNTPNPSLFGSLLTLFYQSCQPELTTSKIQDVQVLYDSLYMYIPFQAALCQKDSSGNYCAATPSKPAKRASLDRRDDSEQVPMPNPTVFSQNNIAFLGLSPNDTSAQLCTPCTREVMNGYTTFMGNFPYGPGSTSSVLFSGLQALYNAINTQCGTSFLGGQVQAAGGLATGAAPLSVDSGFAFVGSAIAAAAAGVVALL